MMAPANKISPLVSAPVLAGTKAVVGQRSPQPAAAANIFSVPSPSIATGMSNGAANAGGDHEEVTALKIGNIKTAAANENASLTKVAAVNLESFSSLNSFSGIGSARETSAMLHPGVVDGSTTQLAGRDSGDRSERRSTNSNSGRNARSCSGIKCGVIEPLGGASSIRDWTSDFPDVTAGETALISSFSAAAKVRAMTCGVPFPLVPEGKPEAIGIRPRRRNPRKFGRDRAERRSFISVKVAE